MYFLDLLFFLSSFFILKFLIISMFYVKLIIFTTVPNFRFCSLTLRFATQYVC